MRCQTKFFLSFVKKKGKKSYEYCSKKFIEVGFPMFRFLPNEQYIDKEKQLEKSILC